MRSGAEVRIAFERASTSCMRRHGCRARLSECTRHSLDVEPTSHTASSTGSNRCAAFFGRRPSCRRPCSHHVRELLGVRALRVVRSRQAIVSAWSMRSVLIGMEPQALRSHSWARRTPVSASAADARTPDGRAAAPRPHRNLVVAATGTGDGRRRHSTTDSCGKSDGRDLSSLSSSLTASGFFEQSRQTGSDTCCAIDRSVEYHGGGRVAAGRHVFAMIQSISEEDLRLARVSSTSSSSTSFTTQRLRAIGVYWASRSSGTGRL